MCGDLEGLSNLLVPLKFDILTYKGCLGGRIVIKIKEDAV